MTTDKGRPETNAVEQTEGFELAATKDGGIGRIEIAQAGITPIDVPKPGAGQTVNVTVVAGRPLKLAFEAADVKAREVVKDDLVLEFENGGKVVLKEYMTAFGMLGEVRTTIIQPDGKHYAFTELLSPTAGPRKTAETPAPGTPGDVVIIQKPAAGEKQSFRLTDEKPMALNFGFGQVAKSQVDADGNLVLTFKDGAVLVLEGYSALKDNKSIGLYFAKGDKISLADLAPGAGPEDPGAEGGRLFTEFAPGGTLGPLDHLGPLPPLPFTLIPPPGPPGSPPGSPPPPPPPPPPNGEKPTWFIEGPDCIVEEIDPPFTFGVTDLMLTGDQTRSIDVRVDFSQPPAADFADFVGGEDFLFLAIQAAAAQETGITVQNLGNGVVRVTFAANASTNQLTFDVLAVDDGDDEQIENFRFVLENEIVTGGAPQGVIIPGPGTSFVDSQILDLDEYQVTISDAEGFEGDQLVFEVDLSNPSGEDIVLDLEAQPLVTVNTNAATPGVDFEAGNFEYSTDGGATWLPAAGPNGTIVTIPAGSTGILVRIETFADLPLEGDESFLLTVANKEQLDKCDVTFIVDGAGYIFDGRDGKDGPTYFIDGPKCLVEEIDPTFTFGVSELMLDPGQTRSIDIRVEFGTTTPGHGAASFADFVGGEDFLFDAITAAVAGETGITVTDLGNGAVRVTFAADASTNQISFNVLAVDDGLNEPVEDFQFVLENEIVTGGAVPGTIVPGEGTSFVSSQVLDPDEYQLTISDAEGFEGDQLVFDLTMSNAADEPIELDLAIQPLSTVDTSAAAPGIDVEAGGFEYSIDGGVTWLDAGGPNGTLVTIPAGSLGIKVRVDTFTDGVQEGDESFLLTVANKDQLDNCGVTRVVEGAGYIFDTGDCQTPPPEWFIVGPPCLIEEVDPPYTIGISDLQLEAGQTRSVDVRVEFLSLHSGHDAASFADLGGPDFLFDALSDAAAGETGITVADLGNGAVRVTFAANASTTQLEFDITPSADDIDEDIEDFRFVLENSTATNGAQAGVIVPGEGSSYVESHIVESDEYSVVFGDDCGCEPPPPPDCDGPRGDWRANWSNQRNAGTDAALAALIALPLAEELGGKDEPPQDRAWNDENGYRGDDHRGGGGRDSDGDHDGGRHGRHDDDRGHRGSEHDSGDSGWRWTHWDNDAGRGDHGRRGSDGWGRSGDGEGSWQSVHDDGAEGGRTQAFGPGQSQDGAAPVVGTPGEDELVGTVAHETLIGGAGDDVIVGGGGADVLRGGGGDDVLVAKAGFAEIHGGAGFDTFKFDDSGVLDLSLLAGKVTGIEQADITGTGNVELKLTFQDLLTMTDSGHQLTILGDSGDKVSADLTGHSVAVADMGSFTRYVIDGGAATLDIDNNVQKNIIGI